VIKKLMVLAMVLFLSVQVFAWSQPQPSAAPNPQMINQPGASHQKPPPGSPHSNRKFGPSYRDNQPEDNDEFHQVYLKAVKTYRLGNCEKALKLLNTLPVKANTQAKYFLLRARIYESQGKTSDSLDLYRRVIALNSRNDFAYEQLGRLLLESGKFKEALKAYEELQEFKYEGAYIYPQIARCYMGFGDFKTAIAVLELEFQESLEADQTYEMLGELYVSTGQPKKAEQLFAKIIKAFPGREQGYRGLIKMYEKDKRYDKIAEICTSALKYNSGNINMHSCLGNAFQKLGRNDKAAVEYRKILELSPGNFSALNSLAQISSPQGKRGGPKNSAPKPGVPSH
jgi:tetratricopeptide (TPR) repeat protein